MNIHIHIFSFFIDRQHHQKVLEPLQELIGRWSSWDCIWLCLIRNPILGLVFSCKRSLVVGSPKLGLMQGPDSYLSTRLIRIWICPHAHRIAVAPLRHHVHISGKKKREWWREIKTEHVHWLKAWTDNPRVGIQGKKI